MNGNNQWGEYTKKKGARLNSNFQYNKTEMQRTHTLQAGRVTMITTSQLTPRCVDGGGDPMALAQWASWTCLEGVDNQHTQLVSVY
jgi:hypothetical protein